MQVEQGDDDDDEDYDQLIVDGVPEDEGLEMHSDAQPHFDNGDEEDDDMEEEDPNLDQMADEGTSLEQEQAVIEQKSDEQSANQDQPQDQEIEDYARFLGMDPSKSIDRELMFIAKQGLMEPVPEPWEAQRDQNDMILYYNTETGEQTHQHPCDDAYRQLFREKKAVLMKERGLDPDNNS